MREKGRLTADQERDLFYRRQNRVYERRLLFNKIKLAVKAFALLMLAPIFYVVLGPVPFVLVYGLIAFLVIKGLRLK